MAIKAKAEISLVRVNDGSDGKPGEDGIGIKSTTVTYQASNSQTTVPTGTWSNTIPQLSFEKPYLWTKTVLTYTDGKSTASYSVSSTIDGVAVGGRNFIAKTDFKDISDYGTFSGNGTIEITDDGLKYTGDDEIQSGIIFNLAEKGSLSGDETYILSFDYRTSVSSFGHMYAVQETAPNVPIYFNVNPVVSETEWKKFECKILEPDINVRNVYAILFPYIPSGWVEIKSKTLKLERGTTATDWTPAPEDLQQDIEDAQNSANNANNKIDQEIPNIEYSMAQIEILNNTIQSMVTDENGESLMEQTADGWTFNISSIQNSLDDALNGVAEVQGSIDDVQELANKTNELANDISKKTAYINMAQDETGAPVMELGQQNGQFKLRITNTSMDFMQGSQRIAYLSNRQLYIQSSVVTDEMKIGAGAGFIWKKRANGNMGLRYVTE